MKTREDLIRYIAFGIDASPYMDGPTSHALRKAENILTAIETAGCVVVPKVATKEMVRAFDELNWSCECGDCNTTYAAMLSASPYRPVEVTK